MLCFGLDFATVQAYAPTSRRSISVAPDGPSAGPTGRPPDRPGLALRDRRSRDVAATAATGDEPATTTAAETLETVEDRAQMARTIAESAPTVEKRSTARTASNGGSHRKLAGPY